MSTTTPPAPPTSIRRSVPRGKPATPSPTANALLRKSYLALYGTKQPTAGVALTARAAAVSRNDSQVISGLAQLHRAEAHAMLGQARDCSDALGAAEDH
ncbi:hypothetical protein ONA70_28040 [Micromonospora yasonensis]|uniref:hypothetical protein n=1 Tax=Micromonospora yasonensis TaxID=1128667 RepID=UPI002230F76F|nr:hypothetical protein [Micromonospora yasonensis]MCW3843947.1 hypothetical protein [Micromonospora yasonensis]